MTRGQCRGHYTEHVKSVRFVTLRRTWEGDDIMLIWFISNLDESVRPPLGSFRPCRDWPGLAWEGVLTSSRPALPYKLSCLQSVFLQPGSVLLSGHGRLWSRQYDSSGLLPFHLFSYNGPPINFTTCLVNIPLWRLPWAEIAQEVVKYHRWMAFYEYNCWICLNQVAPVTKKKKKKIPRLTKSGVCVLFCDIVVDREGHEVGTWPTVTKVETLFWWQVGEHCRAIHRHPRMVWPKSSLSALRYHYRAAGALKHQCKYPVWAVIHFVVVVVSPFSLIYMLFYQPGCDISMNRSVWLFYGLLFLYTCNHFNHVYRPPCYNNCYNVAWMHCSWSPFYTSVTCVLMAHFVALANVIMD